MKKLSEITDLLVGWLAGRLAHSAAPTWVYERRVVFGVEVVLLCGTCAATPTLLALSTSVLALVGALVAQTARSVAARRRELAEASGLAERLRVPCESADERRATAQHVLGGLAPVVSIVGAAAGSGVTGAVLMGALAAYTRWGVGWSYGRWRRAYRAARPIAGGVEEREQARSEPKDGER